jgi:hypothetical protein
MNPLMLFESEQHQLAQGVLFLVGMPQVTLFVTIPQRLDARQVFGDVRRLPPERSTAAECGA